jgi:hypothetical protein
MDELSERRLVLTRSLRGKGESFLNSGIRRSQQDALFRLNDLDPVARGEMETTRHLAWIVALTDPPAFLSVICIEPTRHRSHTNATACLVV